jgi:hypothetical protein
MIQILAISFSRLGLAFIVAARISAEEFEDVP